VSIQKRGGRYVVRWRRDGRQLARTFHRKSDAEAFELEQRRNAQLGAHAPSAPSRQTLGEWFGEWWAAESPLWSQATRVQRAHSLDRWIVPYVGGARLSDFGAKRAREWRSQITATGATPSVANHAQAVLSAALGYAVRDGHLPANPCATLRKLPVLVHRPKALTPLEVETILAALPSQRDVVLASLMVYAALRPGEALALTWDSVTDHLLIIDRSWSYGRLSHTKTHHRRTVEIVDPLRDDLAMHRPARTQRGALVVANQSGGYLDVNNWRGRVWAPACRTAGVDAAPYDLRHTYASLLIHEGRSLPFVAASMGHSRATTTLNHYAHMFDEQRLDTAVPMVEAIRRARSGVRKVCAAPAPRRLRQAAPR
jgi:integrase